MNEEQLKALAVELGKKNADTIAQLFEAKKAEDEKTATALEAKLMNSLGADSPHIKAIQEQLDRIATDLKDNKKSAESLKHFSDGIKTVVNGSDFRAAMSVKNGNFRVELPIDFHYKTTMLNSGLTGVLPKPTWIPGVFRTPDQQPYLADLCPIVPTTSNTVYYVNRTARNNNAAAITEGNALGVLDMSYAQASASVADYGAYIKISANMMEDNDFIAGQINAELPWAVLNAQDAAILTAINAGDTAFSAAGKPYLNNVVDANYFDVLRAAVNQARAANFSPDAILVNVDDYAMMEMSKDLDGQYVIPQFYQAGGLSVSGVRIYPSTTQTSGSFNVCSLNRTPLALRQGLVVEFGYDADDFTKRLMTVRGYVRSAFVFSTQMAGGFIGGTFAAGIAALLKP